MCLPRYWHLYIKSPRMLTSRPCLALVTAYEEQYMVIKDSAYRVGSCHDLHLGHTFEAVLLTAPVRSSVAQIEGVSSN